MTQLETQRWAQETAAVLHKAHQAITESRTEAVRELAGRLPDGAANGDAPVSLAFAGQYSAGKSTILKALTGQDDIAIGAGITTAEIQHYDWEQVTIIDTPGIHTSLRPDHDDRAYEAISKADLLVFVITNELFDSHLAEHYRKLTVDHDKGHETILVVNKMGRHAMGNTAESQAVIADDLRAPLQPFTPEELRVTFTDAASALESREETDPEFREMLEQQGNLHSLITNIDDLVEEKGLNARYTTALYAIDQVLQTAIQLEPTDDPDADALALMYNQNIRAITEARESLNLSILNAIAQATGEIRNVGADLAEHFYPEVSKDEIELAAERAESRVDEIINQLIRQTERQAAEILPTLGQRLRDLESSGLHQETFRNINSGSQGRDRSGAIRVAASSADRLSGLAGNLAFNSTAVARGASGLAQFSGSTAHSMVLNVGHFFGHSFRPWEAVRMASFIGRAAPFLSIAGVVLSVGAQAYADHREEHRSRELQKVREDVRAQFLKISEETEEKFTGEWEKIIREGLGEPLRQLTEDRDELDRLGQEQNAHLEHLNAASEAVNDLIHRIHVAEE